MYFVERVKQKSKELKHQVTTVYYAYQDKRVGVIPKMIIGITILYAVSPIDLIPDFIPVLGYLDDLLIIPALISLAIRLIPKEVMEEAVEKAKKEPIQLKKNWTFGVVFIGIWIIVLYFIVKAIFRIRLTNASSG